MPVVEEDRRVRLATGELSYVLRRSPRSRTLRLVVDTARGAVVTVPPASRRGWRHPEADIERFLREREAWLRRHLARATRRRAEIEALGGLVDGASLRYLGALHLLRLVPAPAGSRRSTVERVGGDESDELVVRSAARDRRDLAAVLETWFRERAAEAIERAVAAHGPALDVQPRRITLRDPRTRWGSATRDGRLSFSWRLVLAPPEALETVVVHELAHLRVFGHGQRFWDLVASRVADHLAWRRWLRRHSYELHAALGDE